MPFLLFIAAYAYSLCKSRPAIDTGKPGAAPAARNAQEISEASEINGTDYLTTFMLYAFDKTAAKDGARRTPESTLHWFSVAGGWPGALIAQQVLRHKSKKKSFRTVFWVTVIINCGILGWMYTPGGVESVQAFFT